MSVFKCIVLLPYIQMLMKTQVTVQSDSRTKFISVHYNGNNFYVIINGNDKPTTPCR